MKHMVIDLNNVNESVMFSNSIIRNFFFYTFIGELEADISPFIDSNMKCELLHSTQIAKGNYTLVDSSSTNLCT